MIKRCFLLLLLLPFSLGLPAQTAYEVKQSDCGRIVISFSAPEGFDVADTILKGRHFVSVGMQEFGPSSAIGQPTLPTLRKMIEIPLCDGIEVQLKNVTRTFVDGEAIGVSYPVVPLQPSVCKTPGLGREVLAYDAKVYGADAFCGLAPVTTEAVGVARDCNLAEVVFSPVQYNPVTNQFVIYTSVEAVLTFRNADAGATMEMKRLHRSPLFGVNIGTVNSLDDALATKGAKRAADRPVRYLIVSDPMFRGYLDEFIEWKRRVGFVVDVAYTDESDVGNTQESIKSYVKSQYDNATDDKPAPSFLLLVGDIEQVPAKSYTYGEDTHVSDLDYALWTAGDNIPDCLYGRFSAQTVSQLYTQLQKTLLYEKYEFDDDSFLDRAILVAGVDGGTEGDLGYTHADPTMDYLAKNYVNGDEKTVLSGDDFYGYASVMEYKNDPSISQGATGVTVMSNSNDVDFRQQCNNGAGFINYTAHGYEQGWAEPGLSNSDVSHMMNARKSGLMIGNCCLTGKFDEPVCFGEALLRRENHCGAVGYIGGSNYTYWGEDFYWAVGYRSSITATMSMNYIASKTGVYDHIFHTHGENYQSWATTLGSIVQQGNMSVQNSNSGLKDYYWQIYHAFGDPSLMPWLTRAKDMPLTYTGMAFGSTEIQVSSAPYAYVALTTADNALLGVAVADIGGNATISLSQPLTEGEYVFAATAQNYKPALLSVSLSSPNVNGCDSKYDINLSIYPNPVANVLNVKAPGLQRVAVADAVGRIVLECVGDGPIDMSGLPSGVYTVRVTANGVVAVRKVIKN